MMTPASKARAIRLARHHLPAVPGIDAEHHAWLTGLLQAAERLAADPIIFTAGLDAGKLCFWVNGQRIGGPAKPLLLAWLVLALAKNRQEPLRPGDMYSTRNPDTCTTQALQRVALRLDRLSPGLAAAFRSVGVENGFLTIKRQHGHPIRCEMTDDLARVFKSVDSA